MSKKRKRGRARQAKVPRGNVVWRQTAEEATLAARPRYNGYACGHGAHGDAKYNRAKANRAWRREIGREGASRGSFPFGAVGNGRFPSGGHRLRRPWRRGPFPPSASLPPPALLGAVSAAPAGRGRPTAL